ncbi:MULTISPECIES: hypothetical protein [Streptomyces]|uniref:Uncharacterized protein n=1 Tax=Streptomyces ramulosus TaxID=47762 RepID=A0ABW1FDD1_9ACTN
MRGPPPGPSHLHRWRPCGHPLLDRRTACGDPEPGWDGPAVLGGHRAAGQLLLVGPHAAADRAPVPFREGTGDGCAVLAPPAHGPALLATAVAQTSAAPRDLLDEAQAHGLGAPHGRAVPRAGRRGPTGA